MPSDKPDEVKIWRHPVSAVQTLTATAFAEKVLEHGLRVVGPYAGYMYCAQETDDGYDMFRVQTCKERYLYQARRVATQANAAGGAVAVDITPATGQIIRIVSYAMTNSGTNDVNIVLYDEDTAAHTTLAVVASGAATKARLPSIGAVATATNNTPHSQDFLIAPGQMLSGYQLGAGAQNDTVTIAVTLELIGSSTEPTWSKARSTNAADVTLAANTIASNVTTFLGCY